jgi:hypothetical protein
MALGGVEKVKPMWARQFVIMVAVFLGVGNGQAAACSRATPSVWEAVQEADIVVFGMIDSIAVDEFGIIQSAVFIPDRFLKGGAEGVLRLHGSSLANSPCAGDAFRPYASGERVMMMLSEDGTGSFEPPLFPPLLVRLHDDHRVAEQRLTEYLDTIITGIPSPVEVHLRCRPQYAVGEEIEVLARVTNHLSIPVILSTDMQAFGVPVIRLRMPDLEYGDPIPNNGHWVIPARGTREISIILQDYFGSMEEGEYFASAYLDVVLDQHVKFWDYVEPENVVVFSVTRSTVTLERSWGETKGVFLSK